MTFSPEEFGKSFHSFIESMESQKIEQTSYFLEKLTRFFGTDPRRLPIVRESISSHDLPNFQLALEAICQSKRRTIEMLGFHIEHHYGVTRHANLFEAKANLEGSVQYKQVALEQGKTLSCLESGLVLIAAKGERAALLVDTPEHSYMGQKMEVAVMAPTREAGEALLAELRTGMHALSVYRGKVLTLSYDRMGEMHIDFHRLQRIERDQIILQQGLLERIEAITIEFSHKRERLRAARRHLKRGMLLYGPPGTGKTLTAMYLAGAMLGRTVILLTGRGMGQVETACQLARMLEPATVIIEDVDLVAENRTSNSECNNAVLFELLNQMDGLSEDMDVLFLLTTNRPEILEPALASRPGRIDQAFEVPLPDREGRRQLLELFAKGLELKIKDWDRLLTRLAGASGAFIRELLRRSVLRASNQPRKIVLRDEPIDEALHEMLVDGGLLTRRLLGFQEPRSNAQDAAE